MNIVAFGLVSSAFLDPGIYLTPIGGIDYIVWAFVELSSEGAMRTLFSILFGAKDLTITLLSLYPDAGLANLLLILNFLCLYSLRASSLFL